MPSFNSLYDNLQFYLRVVSPATADLDTVKSLARTATVIPLPNQPSAVDYSTKTEHDLSFNIKGGRIIRRSVYDHTPTIITIAGSIRSKPTLYPSKGRIVAEPSVFSGLFVNPFSLDLRLSTAEEIADNFGTAIQEYRKGNTVPFPNSISAKRFSKRLQFIDLQRGVVYDACEILDYVISRDTSNNKFGYNFVLKLISYGAPTAIGGVRDTYLSFVSNALGSVNSQLAVLNALIQNFSEGVLSPIDSVTTQAQSIVSQTNQLSNAPRNAVLQAKHTVRAVTGSIFGAGAALLQVIPNIVQGTYSAFVDGQQWYDGSKLDQLLSSVDNLSNFVEGSTEIPNAFVDGTRAALGAASSNLLLLAAGNDEAVFQAAVLQGYLGREQSPLLINIDGGFLASDDGVQRLASFTFNIGDQLSQLEGEGKHLARYSLRMGESIFDVAASLLGDVSLYTEILRINKMSSPHFFSDGTPLQAGSTILVPQQDVLISNSRLSQDPLLTDLNLLDGDLHFGDTSDLQLVSGAQNITQALFNRVRTRQNELLHNLSYGLSAFIGTPNSTFTLDLIAVEVTEQLLSDERILRVSDVTTELSGDRIDVSLQLLLASGDTLEVVVPIA